MNDAKRAVGVFTDLREEVQTVMPDAIQQVDPDSPNSINMGHLLAVAIAEIKRLSAAVTDLQQKVPALTPAA